MRYFLCLTIITIVLFSLTNPTQAADDNKKQEKLASIIIEVKGNPEERKEYIKSYYPYVDVVATYDTLFNGLALQAEPKYLQRMDSLEFVKAVHSVTTYKALEFTTPKAKKANAVIPAALNDTGYTGEGVKVGIIDTGIDYTHPDLANNYVTGYDLVDLDDDPMETKSSQGAPTLHGTHVAGIIAANGDLKGVAPEADIYAYRALGPGGMGTSIQVIAALEQAVDDEVDIINLSLGNSVNGPDYPTSVAVNRAVELGIAVVIANGNSGPNNWTVGAPATASNALSVGALALPQKVPYLYDPLKDKNIPLISMAGSPEWNFKKEYPIMEADGNLDNAYGKIVLFERNKIPFYEKAKQAQEAGAAAVLIANNQKGMFQGSVKNGQDPITIPVASISKQDGDWIRDQLTKKTLYLETNFKTTDRAIADFSSRGPVTVSWNIKPDVIAPGANILSTVPGGYQQLQGTSMAAPHVAGALALLEQAHPDWPVDKMMAAMKTTALPLKNPSGQLYAPISQGMGQIRPKQAIHASTIIYEPLLSFGKITEYKENKTIELTIENTTNQLQSYSFDIPRKEKGMSWNLPQTFTVPAKSKKTVPIELSIVTQQLQKGVHQGWLSLKQQDKTYQLPYLFVNETADYPKAMGFGFELKQFSDDQYAYQLYLTEPMESVVINLYNLDTLLYDRRFMTIDHPKVGMNEGTINKEDIGKKGTYKAIITVELENGSFESYETTIEIK